MIVTIVAAVIPHDVASRVNPPCGGTSAELRAAGGDVADSTGEIKCTEATLAQQEAMKVEIGGEVSPHDLLFRVNPEGKGTDSAGEFNLGERPVAQHVAVGATVVLKVSPSDVAFRVDRCAKRIDRPGEINGT